MLRPEGLLGLSSLTFGFTTASRIVSSTWLKIHALRLSLVGGCRPLELLNVLGEGVEGAPSSPSRAVCNPARSGGRGTTAGRRLLTPVTAATPPRLSASLSVAPISKPN
jgi:hypothetical protein